MPCADQLTAVRTRLARRQSVVLDALLAGDVPAGFDPRTTLATSRTLTGKRFGEARAAAPVLAGHAAEFAAWAREHPREGCACADARAFARGCPDLLDWLRTEEVYDGARRIAFVRAGGRRELVLGAGRAVLHLAVRRYHEQGVT